MTTRCRMRGSGQLVGSGIPAFGDAAFQPTRFDLVDTQTFEGGNAVLTYDRLR